MPEVISLLSSSPPQPEPDTASLSLKQKGKSVPKRALDYGFENFGEETLKRSSSDHQVKRRENDFLFLSDDFDTTGDLEYNVRKKPRISPEPLRRATDNRSSQKIVRKERPQASSSKRVTAIADDIEFSSSPVNPAPRKHSNRASDLLSDPFASPPRVAERNKSAPNKDILSDPFASSPVYDNKARPPGGTWSWPDDLLDKSPEPPQRKKSKEQRALKSAFVDLSSDPFDEPERDEPKSKQSTKARSKAAWDPISSSAPEVLPPRHASSSPIFPPRPSPERARVVIPDDSGSDSDLPDLHNLDFDKLRTLVRSQSLNTKSTSRKSSSSKTTTKKVAKSAEEKEREKREKARVREAEKERKRVEKERAKEDRALQKEKEKALAEVNKVRTDKKVSTPEMIVDIPDSISEALKVQIQALLKDLDVEHNSWNSGVDNVVKWRRKVTSRYNEEIALWEPVPMRIKDEDHVLVIMQAEEMVKLVLAEEGHDLDAHVSKMKINLPKAKLIYLFEGVTAWMRKNKNLLNRQYVSAVRNMGDAGPSSSGQSRRRNNNQRQQYVDEDKIEDALLSLQVTYGVLVHHTTVPVETAQWVAVFTQHISTVPYRQVRDSANDAGFCMESGQVKTGDGPEDTYLRMLQEVTRVTMPIAYGIANKYPNLPALIRGFEKDGPLILEHCRKGADHAGGLSDRAIGPSVSRRLSKIFLGRDPTSTDI